MVEDTRPARPSPTQADATAADQDWCPQENVITYWDGEVCRGCGYAWGSGNGPCPAPDGCGLALVQHEGLHLSPICPAHGAPSGVGQ